MDEIAQIAITRELVEKRVTELAGMGLPTAALATELLTQATILIIGCPAELARENALQFWEKVMREIKNASSASQSADVLPFVVPLAQPKKDPAA